MTFAPHDLWILAIGATIAAACALQGTFLILRREAMMADAISHAVLPGIAAAVLIAGRYEPLVVFVGALAAGVAVPLLVERLRRTGRVYPDAALGAVFTLLFAVGVIVVTRMGNVHLDTDCALYGEIAIAPFDLLDLSIGGREVAAPRTMWTSGAVLLVGLAFLCVFWKEMKIGSFDEGLAAAMGFRPRALQRAFLSTVALTTVAAFDAVGAILVVAMFVAPPAAAYLLTERLGRMTLLSVLLGVAASTIGFFGARAAGGEVSIAGSMATAAGGIFLLAWFFSPTHGLAARAVRLARLRTRLAHGRMRRMKFLGFFLAAVALASCRSILPRDPTPSGAVPFHIGEKEWRAAVVRDPMAETEVLRVTPIGGDSDASWAIVRIRATELLHIHEHSDLIVTLLEGEGNLRMGADNAQTVRIVRAGDGLRIPRGFPHAFENTARGVSTAFIVFTPPAVAGDWKPVHPPAVRRR